jgi:hypothetical protein
METAPCPSMRVIGYTSLARITALTKSEVVDEFSTHNCLLGRETGWHTMRVIGYTSLARITALTKSEGAPALMRHEYPAEPAVRSPRCECHQATQLFS